MNAKQYTLAQARATLPKVKRYMQEIQAARSEILRLRPAALPAIEKAAQNGGCKEAGELYVHGTRIEHGIKGIAELGILVKDLDMGLVDFLGSRGGREVYLCWHYGEDDIAYWHEINGGFGGRQLLDAEIN
jgi:hypothetical protein